MTDDLAQQAVGAALNGHWKEAVNLNSQIVSDNPTDTDALNRLARAYAGLGEMQKAVQTASKVLKIDPYNKIATKSLEKWKSVKNGEALSLNPSAAITFIEEPGKTKIVSLLCPGCGDTLSKAEPGDEVKFNPQGHRMTVLTLSGKYVGRLSDDLGSRMKKLISMGNKYQVFVKSVSPTSASIFIRETYRSPKLADVPSFNTEKMDYISFAIPELVHDDAGPTAISQEEYEE